MPTAHQFIAISSCAMAVFTPQIPLRNPMCVCVCVCVCVCAVVFADVIISILALVHWWHINALIPQSKKQIVISSS